jgi:hypothetical protein
MVEAVGVEPTSEMAAPPKPTCVSVLLGIRLPPSRNGKTGKSLARLISGLWLRTEALPQFREMTPLDKPTDLPARAAT